MKKRLLSLFLVGVLSVSMLAGCGKNEGNTDDSKKTEESSDNEGDAADDGEDAEVTYSNKQVIIGDQSETSGDITPMWTNAASDYNAYKMITGLETVYVDRDGKWNVNETVVDNMEETENEDGSKTWTIKIKDGLKFSNGEAVTAKNYVFYYLF